MMENNNNNDAKGYAPGGIHFPSVISLANYLYPERRALNKRGTGTYDRNLPRRLAFLEGFFRGYDTAQDDMRMEDVKDVSPQGDNNDNGIHIR